MKSIKILGVLFIVFALYWFFIGVRLKVENQSGQEINDVEIKYNRGSFIAESIPDRVALKKSLGKIGEGATFDVKWRENSGKFYKAQFTVYFYGFSGYEFVSIKILPNGKANLYYSGEQYSPNPLGDIST